MNSCCGLLEDNVRFLQQGLELLGRLDDALYARSSPDTFGSGVGAHLRHCLDHYSNFLAGLSKGQIDYDARARDPRLETDRAFAGQKIKDIMEQVVVLRGDDRPLKINMDCGEIAGWSSTTLRRELQFLVSHTVHHYALIRMALRWQGFEVGTEFGMAPSTIKYNQSKTACAQ